MLRALLFLLFGSAPVHMRQNLAVLAEDGSPMCGAVLIDSDKVLTAAHCVMPDDDVMVRCNGEDFPATIEKRDADEDLATLILGAPCSNSSPSPLSELATSDPEIGADVWAIGYPVGLAGM